LEARVNYYGDRRGWYSFKPKEYDMLKKLDPLEQVAGQIFFTNKAIEKGLDQIDISRRLQVSYEEFCLNPKHVFYQILDKLAQQGCNVDRNYLGAEQFQSTNQIRLPKEEYEKIINAYKRFSKI
jgi:hypothetical protein